MTDSKKAQAVGALRKCAKEHEKDFTPTFNIRVSDLCSDVADYLEELEKENAELKKQIKFDEEIIIGEQQEINELQKKIEKMKNVGNCLHFTGCEKINEKEFILGKIVTCKNCKKWKLAE